MPAQSRSAGFTLLELLVVLAIMALVAGIAFPALQHQLARQAMTEARMAVALAVAQARADAVARETPARLDLSSDRTSLVFSSGHTAIALPRGTAIDWPRGGLVFYGDGSAAAGTGTIAVGQASIRFAVEPTQARLEFTL